MQILEWIKDVLEPRKCNSEEFFYDDMESQSGTCLPIIYRPFNVAERMHWTDRGALFDFVSATGGWGKKLLDFGPGDGWPSLIVAPFVGEVVGVEGSRKRYEVCRENAARLGIKNATFEYVEVGSPLPFEANTFDGAMAASSVEQTPDPKATLGEIHRVLKPGGRVRIAYEDLARYSGGREYQADIERIDGERTRVVFYDRHIGEEYVLMYELVLSVPLEKALAIFSNDPGPIRFDAITVGDLERARPVVAEARACRLTHPSGATLARWLDEIGFAQVLPTHSGGRFAGRLFDAIPEEDRPRDLTGLDEMLRPLVGIVTDMAAPVESDPMVTAVK